MMLVLQLERSINRDSAFDEARFVKEKLTGERAVPNTKKKRLSGGSSDSMLGHCTAESRRTD